MLLYYHGLEFCPILVRRFQFETGFRSEVMTLFTNKPIKTFLVHLSTIVIGSFEIEVLPLIEIPFQLVHLLTSMEQNSFP